MYGNFGKHEIPEHAAGLKQMAATRPYMDMSRVGVVGGSYGGYFTIRALLTAPEVYHVGVAYAPVVTLEDNFAPTIEPYMNTPQNNRAGYEYGSLLQYAGNLKGHLLIVHGTWDLDANFSGTMKMSEAFIRAGRFFDLIVMPGIQHGPHGLSMQYLVRRRGKVPGGTLVPGEAAIDHHGSGRSIESPVTAFGSSRPWVRARADPGRECGARFP